MERFERIKGSLRGIGYGIFRFPLSMAFLLIFAVTNALAIEDSSMEAFSLRMACIIGILTAYVAEMLQERFVKAKAGRYLYMAGAFLVTFLYYLLLEFSKDSDMVMILRTCVISFALFITAIWVPSIRRTVSFYESFLSAFKAFFLTALFASVLFGGVSLILAAIDALLVSIRETAFIHTANIAYIVFGITLFLSMVPDFQSVEETMTYRRVRSSDKLEEAEYVKRSITCPKFLERLISYIIVPLTAVFTVILLLYIILNIKNGFWKDDLLEPMLVAYSITVIVVCVLTGTLHNKFVLIFRKIFPKVLILLVALQMTASIMKIQDTGISHGRYYVLIYGLFAILTGVIFSFFNEKKHGSIAAVLIVLSCLSVIPPIDAFTVARVSQTAVLKNTLSKNQMLENDAVTPKASISDEDKDKIVTSFEYLQSMEYTDRIVWLKDIGDTKSFEDVFGFAQYDYYSDKFSNDYYSAFLDPAVDTSITGYDVFASIYISYSLPEGSKETLATFLYQGKNYSVELLADETKSAVNLLDETGFVVSTFDLSEIKQRLMSNEITTENPEPEQMTFVNDTGMRFLFTNLSVNTYDDTEYMNFSGMWFYDFD